ncbi:hypothetical protein SAMN05444365_1011134 [Micromonospora pattaloongensis]|uniref:Uncharacterized protein n=1 Tax=Micromonospora pattaloongensis TaxID=405436 RepID=A0A1H3I7T3_9ACTN|nr:hypothetical protein [Micromonospora pattaloongensis]SDY23004.1 hypothetical protein SAMN05444365_1011134 [Micromonospora pattaloongensis]
MLGTEGYEPQWCHRASALAAAHRARCARIVGRPLDGAWLMWDARRGDWFAAGPVILGFGDVNIEVTHRKFDECAITWGQIDMSMPLAWPGLALDWRAYCHPALLTVRGRRLRAVNVIERITPTEWRPRVLYGVEFLFEGARLAVYNALDENALSDAPDVDLPIGFWRRVSIA